MKRQSRGGAKDDFAKGVLRALKRARRRALRIAKAHNSVIYVERKGRIVAVKP